MENAELFDMTYFSHRNDLLLFHFVLTKISLRGSVRVDTSEVKKDNSKSAHKNTKVRE